MMNKNYKKRLFASFIGFGFIFTLTFGGGGIFAAPPILSDDDLTLELCDDPNSANFGQQGPCGLDPLNPEDPCFVIDTYITMADGSVKKIQDIKVGDKLQGSQGINTVLHTIQKPSNSLIYSFNGGRFFVTDSHPFMTTEGWKSLNPEKTKKMDPTLEVTKLQIGDILVTEKENIKLNTIIGKDEPQTVYTFSVDGTNDYYADGYLVHNKTIVPIGNTCLDGTPATPYTKQATTTYAFRQYGEPGWTDKDGKFGSYVAGNLAATKPFTYVVIGGDHKYYAWNATSINNLPEWNAKCVFRGTQSDIEFGLEVQPSNCFTIGMMSPGDSYLCRDGENGYQNDPINGCGWGKTESISYYVCDDTTVVITPINGVCGSASGSTVSTAPTSNLCAIGTASAVGGIGPWSRSCAGSNGGTTASCSANKTSSGGPIDPIINVIPPKIVDPVQCSTSVLLVGACYKPASGSSDTTLLVKEGKVAINSTTVHSTDALLVNGTVRASSMLNYSDVRLKANVQKIDGALEKVTALNGYRFTWKDSGQPDFGVLAQEVEKVFADAVSTDATGMKAVAYGQLLAPIIEAIKEINITVDSMTLKAQQQAERITALENK